LVYVSEQKATDLFLFAIRNLEGLNPKIFALINKNKTIDLAD